MSDRKLQEARRAHAEKPHDPYLEAAWLRELVRAGELDMARLQLAAYCGDFPAWTACLGDELRPAALHDEDDVCLCRPREWVERLPAYFGRELCIRAAFTVADLTADALHLGPKAPERRLLSRLEGWLEHPTEELAIAAIRAKDAYMDEIEAPEDERPWYARPFLLLALRPPEQLRELDRRAREKGGITGWPFFLWLTFESCAEYLTDYEAGQGYPHEQWVAMYQPQLEELHHGVIVRLRRWALEDVRG